MNKELTSVLKGLIADLPFVDVLAGIVQPVIDTKTSEDTALTIKKKMPVSYDTNQGKSTFLGSERQLVPNQGKKSILYFEDFGSSSDPKARANTLSFISNVRLVCWINKEKMSLPKYKDVTAQLIGQLLGRLVKGTAINQEGIVKLFVSNPKILIQDANIFSRYNYDEAELMYLRPPFEYFAIDLTCKYEYRRLKCNP